MATMKTCNISLLLLLSVLTASGQFSSGLLKNGTLSFQPAPAGVDITANLWQTFEFTAAAGGVTAVNLQNNDGTNGTWVVSDASSVLSTSTSGQFVNLFTVNGVSDTGVKGLAYDYTGGHAAYVDYVFASAPNTANVSFGFWVFIPTGIASATYALSAPFTAGSSLGNLAMVVNGAGSGATFTFAGSSATSLVPWNNWYWITAKRVNGGASPMTVYDHTGALIAGTSSVTGTGGSGNMTQIIFGSANVVASNSVIVYYDNILIDWTNAIYPMVP